MKTERGFFVRYGDAAYSKPFDTLNEARKEAKVMCPTKKLKIYHGILRRSDGGIIDDSQLSLIPRLGGYDELH